MHSAVVLLLSLTALSGASETRGVVINACEPEPHSFSFASLPDSCTLDRGEAQCPVVQPEDLILRGGNLVSPGGVIDLGLSERDLFALDKTAPESGYADSVPFLPKHVYAVKAGANQYALWSEAKSNPGGCFHQEFRWRFNDAGNRFPAGNVGAARRSVAPRKQARTESPDAGYDAKGRMASPGGGLAPDASAPRAGSRGVGKRFYPSP